MWFTPPGPGSCSARCSRDSRGYGTRSGLDELSSAGTTGSATDRAGCLVRSVLLGGDAGEADPGGDGELPEDVRQVERHDVGPEEHLIRHLAVAELLVPVVNFMLRCSARLATRSTSACSRSGNVR